MGIIYKVLAINPADLWSFVVDPAGISCFVEMPTGPIPSVEKVGFSGQIDSFAADSAF